MLTAPIIIMVMQISWLKAETGGNITFDLLLLHLIYHGKEVHAYQYCLYQLHWYLSYF